jgi:hypothetical protein
MAEKKEVYTPPPEIPWTPEEVAFVASRSPRERRLIELARKSLGSSFFLRWTPLFARAHKKI